MFVKVDDEDYVWLSKWKWSYNGKYAHRNVIGNKNILMHRLIIGAEKGEVVDHINLDKLDNRRSNLRKCTNSDNQHNSGLRKDNATGYKGVHKSGRRWIAQIMLNSQVIYLGAYKTPEEAAKKYDAAARQYFGEFARTNF